MQVTVNNLLGYTVPLSVIDGNGRVVPYGLAPYASGVSLTMVDSEVTNLVALRSTGKITYTLTTLPTIKADFSLGAPGRTEVTGTSYTLQDSDRGAIIDFSNAGAITLTLPNNLVRLWSCSVFQYGAGAVTFAAASGATLRLPGTATKTNGQYALASLFVRDNQGGAAAEWVAGGNIA